MRFRPLLVLTSLILAFLSAACANQTPNNVVNPVEIPSLPQPQAGKSVVAGQVKTNTDQQPIANAPVYLAQVYWDADHKKAAFALDLARSPAVTTDAQGFFVFNDIDPNEYVLVVGDFYGQNDVVRESNGDARVYKTDAGKLLNVGIVNVRPLDASASTSQK